MFQVSPNITKIFRKKNFFDSKNMADGPPSGGIDDRFDGLGFLRVKYNELKYMYEVELDDIFTKSYGKWCTFVTFDNPEQVETQHKEVLFSLLEDIADDYEIEYRPLFYKGRTQVTLAHNPCIQDKGINQTSAKALNEVLHEKMKKKEKIKVVFRPVYWARTPYDRKKVHASIRFIMDCLILDE